MSNLIVRGGKTLAGRITPSGNKNSVLPMLAATLLCKQPVTLTNVPEITDVEKMLATFKQLGSKVAWDKDAKTLTINNRDLTLDKFRGNLPVGMRSSVLLLCPLISRFEELEIDLSIGGCSLGIRDIDPHIYMLKEFGVNIDRQNGRITLSRNQKLEGTHLWPDYAGVTATENAVMAAIVADGETVIYNAAAEPHVQNLCTMLISMGAKIEGIGSNRLIITGIKELSGTKATVWSDHHEIATFLAIGAMTGGRVEVENALPEHFPLIVSSFEKLGVQIKYEDNLAYVEPNQSFVPEEGFTDNLIPKIEAAPWPYFPADLLPLVIAVALKTKGYTRFWNKIYEGGLFWVTELTKMGATVEIEDPHRVIVFGGAKLSPAVLTCPYIIRATIALVMTALATNGESTLINVDTIHRAHPNFVENLLSLGADIEEVD